MQIYLKWKYFHAEKYSHHPMWCHCLHDIDLFSFYCKTYWYNSLEVSRVVEYMLNSSPPSAAYMRHWIRSTLVQIMACCLFGAKPLFKPMLRYCQLDPYEQTSVKFLSKYKTFHLWNAPVNIVCKMAGILSRGRWVKMIDLLWHVTVV